MVARTFYIRTDEIHNAVRDTQSAGSLDTTTDILDLSLELGAGRDAFQLSEENLGQRSEAGHDISADQLLRLGDVALLGHLHLQLAATEAEVEDLLNARGLASWEGRVVLGDLVAASDTKVDAALAHEGRDVGGRQEDQGDGKVLDQGDVEAGLAAELDVAAGEEVKGGLLQAALCIKEAMLVCEWSFVLQWFAAIVSKPSRVSHLLRSWIMSHDGLSRRRRGSLALGHGKEESSFQAVVQLNVSRWFLWPLFFK